MKLVCGIVLGLLLLLSTSGCGNEQDAGADAVKEPLTFAMQQEHIPRGTEAPSPTPTDLPAPDDEGDGGDESEPDGTAGGSGNQQPAQTGDEPSQETLTYIEAGVQRTARFTVTSDTVTVNVAELNLRLAPTTEAEVYRLAYRDETLTRTGIGDGNWDRLLVEGAVVYAYASYLASGTE